ncbi:hypothetical protein COBT_003615 [Conglomerata obtusa]
MFNYKCKSKRGRSAYNRTDALCIIEYANIITITFATVILDKKSNTLIPNTCSHVALKSVIQTDKHRLYSCLASSYYTRHVFHLFQIVYSVYGVNTLAVESFNNLNLYGNEKRKVVKTIDRGELLKEPF